jgi:hypothetical protein
MTRHTTAWRWYAFLLGVLGFALVLATKLCLAPYISHLSHFATTLLSAPVALVMAQICFGIFAMLAGRRRRRPAGLTLAPGGFSVPPSPTVAGYRAIWLMSFSAYPLPTRLHTLWLAALVCVCLFWPIAVAQLLTGRPQLQLDPGGLTIRRVRSRRTAWDEFAPGDPLPPPKRRKGYLWVPRHAEPVAGQWPVGESIPVSLLDIEPAFLENVVRHYIEHPDHRAAIGTADELSHLESLPAPSTVDRRRTYEPR